MSHFSFIQALRGLRAFKRMEGLVLQAKDVPLRGKRADREDAVREDIRHDWRQVIPHLARQPDAHPLQRRQAGGVLLTYAHGECTNFVPGVRHTLAVIRLAAEIVPRHQFPDPAAHARLRHFHPAVRRILHAGQKSVVLVI